MMFGSGGAVLRLPLGMLLKQNKYAKRRGGALLRLPLVMSVCVGNESSKKIELGKKTRGPLRQQNKSLKQKQVDNSGCTPPAQH
jgi:hypothetical protein